MSHLFLSYRKKDRDLAQALKARLEAEGYNVWWDSEIPPGADFAKVLEEKLRAADAVVTLWSPNSVRAKWVYFETLMAHDMEKSVPLHTGKCEIPVGLHRFQKYRYDPEWPREHEQWRLIVRQIEEAIQTGKNSERVVDSLDQLVWNKIKASPDPQDARDFLDRHSTSIYAGEARLLLAELEREGRKKAAIWWTFSAIFYIALVIPFVTLNFDYGQPDVWFFTSLYFPFFGFFAIFGIMMVPIYSFSLAKSLRYGFEEGFAFRSRSFLSRATTIAVLIVAPVITCATIAALEVRDGYAPWQFTAEVLDTPIRELTPGVPRHLLTDLPDRPDIFDDDRTVREVFDTIRSFDLKSLLESRNSRIEDVPCLASPRSLVAPTRLQTDPDCVIHMNNLQRVMEHVHRDPSANSYTSYAYQYCFFFFALAFMGTYFNIYVMTVRSERARVWMARLSPWSGQRYSQLLYLFALQLMFISVWFIARMLFQLETQTILPSSGRGQFSQVIRNSYFLFFIVYLICIGSVVAAVFRFQNRFARLWIVLIAIVTATLLGLAFSVTRFSQALQLFIGVHATTASIVVLAIVSVFVLFVPLVLPNLLPVKEEDLAT